MLAAELDVAPRAYRLLEFGADGGRIPVDQRDASLGIQQIVHLKISRRGVPG